jgi:hypothetical protein
VLGHDPEGVQHVAFELSGIVVDGFDCENADFLTKEKMPTRRSSAD